MQKFLLDCRTPTDAVVNVDAEVHQAGNACDALPMQPEYRLDRGTRLLGEYTSIAVFGVDT